MREDGGRGLKVVVRLATALRSHAGGASQVEVDLDPPVTVGRVLDAVAAAHPGVGRRVRDEAGTLRTHVNVFVGTDNLRDLDALDTVVGEGDEVAIMAAVSGGCGQKAHIPQTRESDPSSAAGTVLTPRSSEPPAGGPGHHSPRA